MNMISNCLVVLMAVQEHINKQIHLLNMLSESTHIFMIPIFISGKIQVDHENLENNSAASSVDFKKNSLLYFIYI